MCYQESRSGRHAKVKKREAESALAISAPQSNVLSREEHSQDHQYGSTECNGCAPDCSSAIEVHRMRPHRRVDPWRDHLKVNRLSTIGSGRNVNWRDVAVVIPFPIFLNTE